MRTKKRAAATVKKATPAKRGRKPFSKKADETRQPRGGIKGIQVEPPVSTISIEDAVKRIIAAAQKTLPSDNTDRIRSAMSNDQTEAHPLSNGGKMMATTNAKASSPALPDLCSSIDSKLNSMEILTSNIMDRLVRISIPTEHKDERIDPTMEPQNAVEHLEQILKRLAHYNDRLDRIFSTLTTIV